MDFFPWVVVNMVLTIFHRYLTMAHQCNHVGFSLSFHFESIGPKMLNPNPRGLPCSPTQHVTIFVLKCALSAWPQGDQSIT